jgi:hypothetical protein
LLQVKGNVVVIYDPADEVINLSCSSFLGVIFLLHQTITDAPATPTTPSTVKKTKSWWRKMSEISKQGSLVFGTPDRLMAQIDGVISPAKIEDLHQRLSVLFEFVKLVDLDARIDESQTLRRASSFRMSTRDIGAQVTEFLKKNPLTASRGSFNDKEGLMLKAFAVESNGLSEIIIKFVKFMHRMEVCTLSAFDLFCPKVHDSQMLKVFFWLFWFMHRSFHLRDDSIFLEAKFNPGAILKGFLTSHRQL